MTAAAGEAAHRDTEERSHTAATGAAATHRDVRFPGLHGRSPYAPADFGPALDRARDYFATRPLDDHPADRPAEWLLDNYFLVRRAAAQVAEDLPAGFVRRLPHLASGPGEGRPRVHALALAFVAERGAELDLATLRDFVDAYQEVLPLTIAELWALPTMLRAVVLTDLLAYLADLHAPVAESDAPVRRASARSTSPAPGVGVAHSVRALRVLDEIDWKVFFESASRVESELCGDPAGVYAGMDFDTCDTYRKAVEDLAWVTRVAEEEVAARVVSLASESAPDPRRGHVGFYLVGEGRPGLERQLGYRPRGAERVRRLVTRWPTLTYLAPLLLLTLGPLLLLWRLSTRAGAWSGFVALAMVLAAVPLWSVAVAMLQSALARLLPPRRLPKLDYSAGIPATARALVVIPTLLGRREDVGAMLSQIELHYLNNPDPQLGFALLTDHLDSVAMPEDGGALLEEVSEGIARLNAKHAEGSSGPFHLLHREPLWNPSEQRFMGWERKRGKLEELNRLLRGDQDTTFVLRVGDPKRLERIRFVITLDSDTELPMGSAHRLVGLLAHPLNQACVDPKTGRVTAGYTIVQPRLETSPSSVLPTSFARIFAGDVGFDIYTHASSDLYQDLFGSGIYCGKGIYDVDAFTGSLDGRVPENAIVSHDLLEGVHGRVALASDIVFFEQYPTQYAAFSRRMHRWVRGDWQLLPWLLSSVPSSSRRRLPNRLSLIDRWKIADNLRRSLTAPSTCGLLLLGWTSPPFDPLLSTLLVLAVLVAPLTPALLGRGRGKALARGGLAVVFLMSEATVVIDAIVRVFVRTYVTRKHLLQWTSAAHTAAGLSAGSIRARLWRDMFLSPLSAALIGGLLVWLRPSALVAAGPVLLAWALAPEIARLMSRPVRLGAAPLEAAERKQLRLLARRTWLFFETFVGPVDQWLPIDNYQEPPHEQTAHRTSPTNIGLMLLSTVSAYDFGYLGPSELALRLRRAFDSIARLEHYRGHLLNWYETKNLTPLLPQYVSTVDSGNFVGALIATAKGCRDAAEGQVVRGEVFLGLRDSLELLDEDVASLRACVDPATLGPTAEDSARALGVAVTRMRARLEDLPDPTITTAHAALVTLGAEASEAFDQELLTLVKTGAYRHEPELLDALRGAVDRLRRQLEQTRSELELVIPWLTLGDEPARGAVTLPERLRLDEVAEAARRSTRELDEWEATQRAIGDLDADAARSAARLRAAFSGAEERAESLVGELSALASEASREARGADFRLLFDAERRLFCIGYNVTNDQLDPHHYDLLASEARLASYLAIVEGQVPEAHWYALGRPMNQLRGRALLLSWGGTMFEYLMPSLLMRSRPGTLLQQSEELAVEVQVAYGQKRGAPWGVSESAYARVDANQTHQYRSFGVPGLGLKRGLGDDLVVAPYASLLALSVAPRAVVENLARLSAMGMRGAYGLFEAVDLNPDLHAGGDGAPHSVVRSYMAHHQGMLLVAIDNYLNDQIMVDRFHSDASVQAGEMLLNERTPAVVASPWPLAAPPVRARAEAASYRASAPWSPDAQGRPQAFVLGNARLSSVLTDRGGGGLRWKGIVLTRYRPDATCDGDGVWLYVRDEDSGETWLGTSDRGRTTYAAHRAEFHQRDRGISVRVDVAVAPTDDVELRQVTLHNETDRERHLTVTSAGEPVLLPLADAAAHPAFGRMFVESAFDANLEGLVFTRRAKSEAQSHPALVHRLVRGDGAVTFGGHVSDRGAFFGRGGSARAPQALRTDGVGEGRTGAVIDPVMAVTARAVLPPNGSLTFAFVTAVGHSRRVAVALAGRYGTMHAVRWALRDAEQESPRRLARAGIEPEILPAVQRLLSALLFSDPTFRAPPRGPWAPGEARDALFRRGISGTRPIVMVRVADPDAVLVEEVVIAHRFLSTRDLGFDLLLMDEAPSGYLSEGTGTLRGVLLQMGLGDQPDQRSGVYLLSIDGLGEEEYARIEATADVVLDTREGTLADRMGRPAAMPPKLPLLEPERAVEAVIARPSAAPPLLFGNGRGGFSEDGREYVISVRPDAPTPAPWCNVLANPEFGCLVSESALGSTWSLNAGENRLTPWRNDPVFDTPSEVLYLRDEETAAVWSSTPSPAGRDVETTVHHGAGYTRYVRESHGLFSELTVFVPPSGPLKVVRLRVKNRLPRHRRLTATYYAEWVLGGIRGAEKVSIQSELDRESACLLATCSWTPEFGGRVAFLASELAVHGFTVDRAEFLGRSGDYALPEALTRWGLSGQIEPGVDPCGALQVHLELDPAGEANDELRTHFVLGQAATRDEAVALASRFREPSEVDAAFEGLRRFWDGLLGAVRVKTPEPAMDLLLNRWLLYQSLSSRIFGRNGFYQSSGAFGFRDQLQDVLALMHAGPELARAHILEAASHQFEEGDVLHWWHPPSGRGVRTRYSDDLLWLPFVTAGYVAATGDTSILAERVPFLHGVPLQDAEYDRYTQYAVSTEEGTLLDHGRRALERALTRGPRGLPLMGGGDWNDGMNLVGPEGRGESVWLAWFLCATINRFATSCERFDPVEGAAEAAEWRARSQVLLDTIEATAWDGDWYVRAFHDDGSVLGSSTNDECAIDSIAQSWAVLSQVGDPERARIALESAHDRLVLDEDRLVLLLHPPFDVTPHDPGYIRAYPPGVRENGGQYTHAAAWLGMACAERGDGRGALRIFQLINPILRTRTAAEADRYRVEPYVLPGDVYGAAPWIGRGGWTWYTGAAPWTYRLGVEAILGLRLTDGELAIDPCIPPEWSGFEAWVRTPAGGTVHVLVDNPDSVGRGVRSITLGGVAVASATVPLEVESGVCSEVRVCLGAPAGPARVDLGPGESPVASARSSMPAREPH